MYIYDFSCLVFVYCAQCCVDLFVESIWYKWKYAVNFWCLFEKQYLLSLFFWKKWDNTNFFKCLFIWQSLVEFYQGRIVSLLPLFDWDDPKIVIVMQSHGSVEDIPSELQHMTGIIKCWSSFLMKFRIRLFLFCARRRG